MKTAIVLLSIFALATARPQPKNARAVCGTTFTSSSGNIQSPNYPSNYANDVDCTSTVPGIPGEVITIVFNDFNLESANSCKYDYVQIYDGNTPEPKLCGSSLPAYYTTTRGNGFRLVFHSDYSVTRTGFDVTFYPGPYVPPPPPSGNKPTECGRVKVSARDADRIVGGAECTPHTIPWQVSLQKPTSSGSSTYYHFCGASIISDTYVVTASHCVDGQSTSTWRIVVGAHNVRATSESSRQTLGVKRAVMHENYDSSTFENDIAILELNGNININNYAQPICVPKAGITSGTVTVSGWGTLSSGGSSPDNLQYVDVPIVPDSVCRQSDYYGTEFMPTSMICAGVTGKDSCQGDSGGPLYHLEGQDYTLDGVVSWGYGCAGAKKPGVYARAFTYRDWIIQQTGIQFD